MPIPYLKRPLFPRPTSQGHGGNGHGRPMYMRRQHLHLFWMHRLLEIRHFTELRSQHHLPLSRVKRIMKSDEEVKMVSADAPVLFTKACEIFILELTLRAWFHTEDSERRTLQRCDIARVVKLDGLLDFLVDLFCSDDFMEENIGNSVEDTQPLYQAEEIQFPVMNMRDESAQRNRIRKRFITRRPTSTMNLLPSDEKQRMGDKQKTWDDMVEEKAHKGQPV